MDCQTARQWIDLHPRTSRDWEGAEGAEVRNHLAGCELCRHAVDDIHEFDGRVKSLLHEVAIPEGLRDRILAQVQLSSPRMEPRKWGSRKWGRRLVGLGLSLMLALGVGYWATRASAMTVAGLGDSAASMLLAAKSAPVAFDGSFQRVAACSESPLAASRRSPARRLGSGRTTGPRCGCVSSEHCLPAFSRLAGGNSDFARERCSGSLRSRSAELRPFRSLGGSEVCVPVRG